MKLLAVQSIKFLRLKRALNLPHYAAVGLLESLWLFAQTNARDGNLERFTPDDIAAALEWAGDARELVKSLTDSGWLDASPTLKIHDWEEHSPRWVRGILARQERRNEAKKDCQINSTECGTELSTELPTELATEYRTELATQYGTTKTKTKTNTKPNTQNILSNVFPEAGKSGPGVEQTSPAVFRFPVIGPGGPDWVLTEKDLADFSTLFPGVDCLAQCRSALAWVSASLERRKTSRGMKRFLTGWLQRHIERRQPIARPSQTQAEKLAQSLVADRVSDSVSISRPQISPIADEIGQGWALPQLLPIRPAIANFGGN